MNAKLEIAPGSENVLIKKTVSLRWLTKMSHQNSFAQFRRWYKVQSNMQLQKENTRAHRKKNIITATRINASDYSASLCFSLCNLKLRICRTLYASILHRKFELELLLMLQRRNASQCTGDIFANFKYSILYSHISSLATCTPYLFSLLFVLCSLSCK